MLNEGFDSLMLSMLKIAQKLKIKLSHSHFFLKLFICRIAAGISNFFKKDKASPTSAKSPPEMGRTKSPEIRRREMGTRSPEVRRRDTGEKESKTPELDRRPSPAARVSDHTFPHISQVSLDLWS